MIATGTAKALSTCQVSWQEVLTCHCTRASTDARIACLQAIASNAEGGHFSKQFEVCPSSCRRQVYSVGNGRYIWVQCCWTDLLGLFASRGRK